MRKNSYMTHTELMQFLAEKHLLVLDLIGERPIHYVDIPVHGNIGDLLIMLGTLAFFKRHGLVPRFCAPAFAYEPGWIEPGNVIVFHGGGNFGDLYSEYGMQALREHVVATYPDNRIIVLPQTIHFSTEKERRRSAKVFRSHPDVHICVRDRASYDIALEFSNHVYLMPDMAHQLYPINAAATGTEGSLLISRMDGEKRAQHDPVRLGASAVTDWPQLVGGREGRIERYRRAMRMMHRSGTGRWGNKLLSSLWAAYANKLTNSAVRLFSSHELIITDRLHGHILACLMDKPSIVLDNSYGKNSGYVNAWTLGSELVSLEHT